MFDVCICDDNSLATEEYFCLVNKIAQEENIEVNISIYNSGEQLLFTDSNLLRKFDLVYLDMLMGEMNGIETGRRLREAGYTGSIVFLTSSREHTLEAFDVSPLNYLVKQDLNEAKFREIFLKAANIAQNHVSDSFAFEFKNIYTRVALDEILYFEVKIRLVTLYTKTDEYSFYSKIEMVEKQLIGKFFARCHRAFVVNLQHIRSLSAQEITLTDGSKVPIGNKYFKDLKSSFSAYLEKKGVMM